MYFHDKKLIAKLAAGKSREDGKLYLYFIQVHAICWQLFNLLHKAAIKANNTMVDRYISQSEQRVHWQWFSEYLTHHQWPLSGHCGEIPRLFVALLAILQLPCHAHCATKHWCTPNISFNNKQFSLTIFSLTFSQFPLMFPWQCQILWYF